MTSAPSLDRGVSHGTKVGGDVGCGKMSPRIDLGSMRHERCRVGVPLHVVGRCCHLPAMQMTLLAALFAGTVGFHPAFPAS